MYARSEKLLFMIVMLIVNNVYGDFSLSRIDTSPKIKPKYTIAQFIPFSYWHPQTPLDPCLSGNPAIGTSCASGTIYAGIFDGGKYMVTPGNCTDSATPTCDGSLDSLQKSWNGSTGSHADLASIDNLSEAIEHSSPSQRGDVLTPLIVAAGTTSADSAAHYCSNLNYGGYTDWYLPSKSELTYIICNNSVVAANNYNPQEDPDCIQFGGNSSGLTGFQPYDWYQSSTELSTNSAWRQLVDHLSNAGGFKDDPNFVRCVRRYDESSVDIAPDPISFTAFNDYSSLESISGFDETIFLELSASNISGTPDFAIRINSGTWKLFSEGASRLFAVRDSDTIELRIIGNVTDSGTITIKNATDDSSTPTLNTVVATVTDNCVDNPAIGSTCGGGALYAGIFDGGKYMVTPSGCTDSSTPICAGGTDTTQKAWYGTSGTDGFVVGVETVTASANFSSPSFRGDVNTAAMVASGLVSANSAAHFCNEMSYGGYSDWYLPTNSELAYIYCKADEGGGHDSSFPNIDPNCIQFGGEQDILTGFDTSSYQVSSQRSVGNRHTVDFADGSIQSGGKSALRRLRCVRRYDTELVDEVPNSINWFGFNDSSSVETISGFDETIFLEFSATNLTGSPTFEVVLNSGARYAFSDGSAALVPVRSDDTLEIEISGSISDSGTVTVKNATDEINQPTLATVTGIVTI